MKRILLFIILILCVTVGPALAAYDVIIFRQGESFTTSGSPLISSVSFSGYTFLTTQTNSSQAGYLINGGLEAWGYKNGGWALLSSISPNIRWTNTAYSQLVTLWAENYTYNPALGSPAQQFPNGLSDIDPPPASIPIDLDKVISFLLGGLTGFGFVLASCTRW